MMEAASRVLMVRMAGVAEAMRGAEEVSAAEAEEAEEAAACQAFS